MVRLLLAAGCAVAAAACSRSARISAEIDGAPSTDIVIRQQNINRFDILDTVRTDASGKFTYRVRIEKDDPDFFYIYKGGDKVASLLLQRGDHVHVSADTCGNYTVSGSVESERLAEVEKDYSDFCEVMDSLAREIELAGDDDNDRVTGLNRQLVKEYTTYYRSRVKYVMEHSASLTTIPVFYQTVADNFYVFSQDTDALHFRNISDSLAKVYPESRYVKALRDEAEARSRQLELRIRMQTAESIGFLDLELPDVKGSKVKLSDVDSRVILLCFWSPADALQKMDNVDLLKKAYVAYKDKGLEIYQVAIAADKPAWERVVNAQGLEWINVCDGLGQNSPSLGIYNVSRLPAYFLIVDGQLADMDIVDGKSLMSALREVLK